MANDIDEARFTRSSRHGISDETVKDYLAAAALHQIDKIRYYIECQGLHPDATYGGKPTALCYAVLKPNYELMCYVIERGADANHIDQMGMSPLHYAALGGCERCLASLVRHGAFLNATNRCGQTPLALAMTRPGLAGAMEFLRRCGASLDPAAPGAKCFH